MYMSRVRAAQITSCVPLHMMAPPSNMQSGVNLRCFPSPYIPTHGNAGYSCVGVQCYLMSAKHSTAISPQILRLQRYGGDCLLQFKIQTCMKQQRNKFAAPRIAAILVYHLVSKLTNAGMQEAPVLRSFGPSRPPGHTRRSGSSLSTLYLESQGELQYRKMRSGDRAIVTSSRQSPRQQADLLRAGATIICGKCRGRIGIYGD